MSILSDVTSTELDQAPVDVLRFAFTPPRHIREHEELGPLFDEIVVRMRREAEDIPLETNQLLLLSKIALGFVEMKWRDEHGWNGINSQKDANAQWLALLREWNDVLKENREKVAEKTVEDFKAIVLRTVEGIQNNEDRRTAIRFVKEKFAEKGY